MKNMKITPCQYVAYTSYARPGRCPPLRRRSRYSKPSTALKLSKQTNSNRYKVDEYPKKIAM